LRDLLCEARGWSLWLSAFGVVMGLLAACAPLASVAGHAGLAAASAPALRVATAALVEVGAAHLLGEDVDYVLLLASVWASGGKTLEKVATSVVSWGLRVLRLCWELLQEASVHFAWEELVAAGSVLG